MSESPDILNLLNDLLARAKNKGADAGDAEALLDTRVGLGRTVGHELPLHGLQTRAGRSICGGRL